MAAAKKPAAKADDASAAAPAVAAVVAAAGQPGPGDSSPAETASGAETAPVLNENEALAQVREVVLGFPVLMHLAHDGKIVEPGAIAFVTEEQFDQLQRVQVFARDLEWEDGEQPEEPDDGQA